MHPTYAACVVGGPRRATQAPVMLTLLMCHQNAIDAYHHATRDGAPKSRPRASLRDTLQRTGAELNQMFRQELAQLTGNWFPRSRMLVSGRTTSTRCATLGGIGTGRRPSRRLDSLDPWGREW